MKRICLKAAMTLLMAAAFFAALVATDLVIHSADAACDRNEVCTGNKILDSWQCTTACNCRPVPMQGAFGCYQQNWSCANGNKVTEECDPVLFTGHACCQCGWCTE